MRKLLFLVFLFFPIITHAQTMFSGDSLMMLNILPILPLISPVYAKEDIWYGYPILKRICGCESTGNPNGEPSQFDDNGNLLWSQKGTADVGACQINVRIHKKLLKKMGLDVINSFEDNVEFAKYLYDRYGIDPWRASLKCWIK